MIEFISHSLSDTLKLGNVLSETIPSGAVVSLEGTLGSGKTALVRAIAIANGESPDNISSPTFVLIQEYTNGKRPIYHFDAYRIADDDEFLELGPEEYFESDGITFIEWADRVINCLPESFIRILAEQIDNQVRKYNISIIGDKYNLFMNNLFSNSIFL